MDIRGRGRKRWWIWLALAPLALILGFVGVGTVTSIVGGPCAFDPVPGDQTSYTLVNDMSGPITFVNCEDANCRTHHDLLQNGAVPSGKSLAWTHEACSVEPVGMVDAYGTFVGCIVLPVADPPKVTTWRASLRGSCAAGN